MKSSGATVISWTSTKLSASFGPTSGAFAKLDEEFERTLDAALRDPKIGAAVAKTEGGLAIRRFRLRRFYRYAIYVALFDDVPTAIAFEHASRRPEYWLRRVK